MGEVSCGYKLYEQVACDTGRLGGSGEGVRAIGTPLSHFNLKKKKQVRREASKVTGVGDGGGYVRVLGSDEMRQRHITLGDCMTEDDWSGAHTILRFDSTPVLQVSRLFSDLLFLIFIDISLYYC